MSSVAEIGELLERTQPPRPLLTYHPEFVAPPYMVDPVTRVSGRFHPPPYSLEEREAIREAKVAADKSGEQTRADSVLPHLMIGNLFAAQDTRYLAGLGVTHLLNTAGIPTEPDCVRPKVEELAKAGISLLTLEINDRSSESISDHFPTSGAWIREAVEGGGTVLVNCFQGASRSATIVLAYMLQHEGFSLPQAIVKLKQSRDVRPNDGFLQQLIDWEAACKKN